MFFEEAESRISEYLSSEHLLFLHGPEKEGAESVLSYFFHKAAESGRKTFSDLTTKDIQETFLTSMPLAQLPVDIRKAAPKILVGFFDFLSQTGRVPSAKVWAVCVESLTGKYLASLRDDGTVKGTTFRKNYTDVGRNDLCPCGSGLKFKKCCMPLIA